jgi:hypothetical protein
MANKRIELEQYKYYVNLIDEEPNRKTVRRGFITCAIVMMLLVMTMFVLGVLSINLAKNPNNIIEKPQGLPTDTGQQQIPTDTGQQQIPTQSPIEIPSQTPTPAPTPTPGPSGKYIAPGSPVVAVDWSVTGMPAGAGAGDLLAQATPGPEISVPSTAPSGTSPSKEKPKKPPLPETTKGAGSLSKLTTGAGGRGLQLYMLVLGIGLMVLLYLGIRRVRLEGKSK